MYMFLRAEQIQNAVSLGELIISPFTEQNLKPASYTLTLGEILVVADTREEVRIEGGGYRLQPGSFILGKSQEHLNLNGKFLCLLGTRGSIAQLGVDAVQSSSIAEPDTDAKLTLEIVNHGPKEVLLTAGMPIVKAIFCQLKD
jgi:deoxycytidine triphosphate deaminase